MATDRNDPTCPRTVRHAHGAPRGFTLVEVMVAATLGALLLTATASMAGMFGSQLKELDGTQDASLEETLTSLSDEVRYAWWAQVPDSASLTLSDPQGRATRYQFRAGNLLVVRPDGQQGFLLQGLQGGSFSAETVTRYREGSTRVRGGTFWSRTLPVGTTPGATVLEANGKLAIGFTLDSHAPLGGSLVPGVPEQLLSATPTSVSLPLASIMPLAATLTVSLYRARAPGDARPEGAALGTFTINPSSLPAGTAYVWNTQRSLKVSAPLGALWGWWKLLPNLVLVASAPTASVALDLGQLGITLTPGRAYTLQLSMSGIGGLVLATGTAGAANDSGVAMSTGGAPLAEAALTVACALDGTVSVTETLANTVVDRVAIDLVGSDGTEVSGSVTLTGQGMADDRWLGIVPGETDP